MVNKLDARRPIPGNENAIPEAVRVHSQRPLSRNPWRAAARIQRSTGNRAEGHYQRSRAVLVADDEMVSRKLIGRILQRAGYRVHVVPSVEGALNALERPAFDVLIVGVNMPDAGELDLIKLYRLAQLGRPPRLPIVALSADAARGAAKVYKEAGVDASLLKPVKAQRLLEAIVRLTGAQETEAAASSAAAATQPDVEYISAHPRYRAEIHPAINWTVIDELGRFTDRTFALGILQEGIAHIEQLVQRAQTALGANDAQAFRRDIDALCSSSRTIGAEAMAHIGQEVHGMSWDRLRRQGRDYTDQLERELARLRREISRRATAMSPSPG